MPIAEPIAASLLQGGAQLLSNVVGLTGQSIQNRKNLELAKYSYGKDLEMWNRQNLYNLPSAQMQRLKAAGLNPNLVYGSGTAVPLSAPAPKMGTPDYTLDTSRIVPDPMGVIGAYQQVKMAQAQTDNIEAQTANAKIDGANKAIQTAILEADAEKRGIDLQTLRATQPYQVDIVKHRAKSAEYAVEQALKNLGKTDAEIANLKAKTGLVYGQTGYLKEQKIGQQTQNEILKQDLIYRKFENLWAEKGITKSDNLYVRILSRVLDQAGLTIENGYDTIVEFIKSLPEYLKGRTGATGEY